MPSHLASVLIASTALLGAASASANADLAKAKNCLACHSVDRKLVGPSYKDIAAKYRSDKGAAAKLAAKVRAGGSGVWGTVPMPPNPQVSEAEAATLVNWVLSAK
ncbi:MAG: c-type cytochrome [Burkholderiaceae bacterium]|nr:c-type cytochrome [Burkholderiaceae bacterium]